MHTYVISLPDGACVYLDPSLVPLGLPIPIQALVSLSLIILLRSILFILSTFFGR